MYVAVVLDVTVKLPAEAKLLATIAVPFLMSQEFVVRELVDVQEIVDGWYGATVVGVAEASTVAAGAVMVLVTDTVLVTDLSPKEHVKV